VPRVVGFGLRKAKARLVARHCRVGRVTKRFSTVRKRGRVVAQKPRSGRRLKTGARVNLVLGKGPRRR
jgi:beta-lactam-binding protein with PASTA domain